MKSLGKSEVEIKFATIRMPQCQASLKYYMYCTPTINSRLALNISHHYENFAFAFLR